MNEKFKRASQTLIPLLDDQAVTPVGKGERLRGRSQDFLKFVDPSLERQTRQRLTAQNIGTIIEIKSVMTLMTEMSLSWGLLPLDQLLEWAALEGYQSLRGLKEKFEILFIGGGECTIEMACDPARTDIIKVFKTFGVSGLRDYLVSRNERIATDKPGIAKYFFGSSLLSTFGGSLEALPKAAFPVIVGTVETGNSLDEEGWLRLREVSREAILLASQLVVVIAKDRL